MKKYKEKHSLNSRFEFKIPCEGIPKNSVSPELGIMIPSELEKQAQSIVNPVIWAHINLTDPDGNSFVARSYQEQMLLCTSKRQAWRCGRQIGKTESLIILTLFNLFTRSNYQMAIAAPHQNHIRNFFTRIRGYISRNIKLRNSMNRNVDTPLPEIELKNGSRLRGFVPGGNEKDFPSIRGQSIQFLLYDEADLLTPDQIDVANATTYSFGNDSTIILSSTPTGKKERFYDLCNSRTYREIHFPSQISPTWTIDLDIEAKQEMTSLNYKKEILAEFSEDEMGVYQKQYIAAARKDYLYKDMIPSNDYLYFMGVDWNDQINGTQISIIGYHKYKQYLMLMNHHNISKDGWTQLAAIEKIRELNRIWKCMAIYVDVGYGGTQLELLRNIGLTALKEKGPMDTDAALRNVVGFDFGSKIMIRDFYTKELVPKDAKPFLVENSVRFFEQNMFFFSSEDIELKTQLEGYIIKKMTASGRPVYGTINSKIADHKLDAINLALVAYSLTYTPLNGKLNAIFDIKFTKAFGEPTEAYMERQYEKIKPRKEKIEKKNSLQKLVSAITPNFSAKVWSRPGWNTDQEEKFAKMSEQRKITKRNIKKPSRIKF